MMNEHRHGGMPEDDIKRLGLQVENLLDFSVNLNPLGPPEVVRENWVKLLAEIEYYPSLNGEPINKFYMEKFGVPPQACLPGNGSTELIYLIPRVFSLSKVLVITPCYNDYLRASILSGAQVITFSLQEENGFVLDELDGLIQALYNVDGMWIGRPNNPTGTLLTRDIMLQLVEAFPEKLFVVDEAFIQFVSEWEEESLLFSLPRPNLLVLHSLTKFYAIAGLRLGAVISHPSVIERLKEHKEPWTVNGVALAVASLLLECSPYEARTREIVSRELTAMQKAIDAIDGIRVYDSKANFLLCKWEKTQDLDDLMAHLLRHACYVRDCRNFPGLENNFFRIGVRNEEDNRCLLEALARWNPFTS